jgi:hypothetical protein
MEAKREAEEIRQAAFRKKAKKRGRKEWEEGSDEEEEAIPVGVMKVGLLLFCLCEFSMTRVRSRTSLSLERSSQMTLRTPLRTTEIKLTC